MSKTCALASTLPIIFLLCCSQLTISLSQNSDVDVPTLLKIKEQFGNPDALSAWKPGTDHCQWPHVQCNDFINIADRRRVFMLDFKDLNGTSPIPPAIADLAELQQLYITDNSVSGPVPGFLCRNIGLTILVLHNNSLTGRIPECLAELQSLRFLDLESNGLTGPIPRNLSAVQMLVLADNKLSGDASYLLGGSRTTMLNLAGNKLRFDLTNVQIGGSLGILYLSHNDIYGQVPVSLQNSTVEILDLSYNELSGNASFLLAKPMWDINLAGNKLRFDLTNVVLAKISTLDLSHNCISGQVPASLRDSRVETLNLSYNELCGEIPTGGQMSQYGAQVYEHNKCLCGTPLPPCCGGGR